MTIGPPRFEDRKAMLVAGLSGRFNPATTSDIAALWQRFEPSIGNLPGQTGHTTYGVCCNYDGSGGFDYICAAEVADLSLLPAGMTGLRIPEQSYAVFTHGDHISAIGSTWQAIFGQWLPSSGYRLVDDAPQFELYDEKFDPRTGTGPVDIWIPVQPRL